MSDPEIVEPAHARVVGDWRPALRRLRVGEDLRDQRFDPGGVDEVDFDNVTVERVEFSGFRFNLFTSAGSRFVDCDFSKTRFKMSGGFSSDPPSSFVGCRFDGADLRAMFLLKETRFERCSFVGARIEGWQSWCAEFVDCTFGGRIVRGDSSGRPHHCFAKVTRTRNEFHGNDFRQVDLVDTRFSYGIDIDAQLWPDDPIYIRLDQWPARVEWAEDQVRLWENTESRNQALAMLEIYSNSGMLEQQSVFLRRDTLRNTPESVRDAVWRLLEEAPHL